MEQFTLSPRQQRDTATIFSREAGELERTISTLKTASDTLLDGWKGAGSEEFGNDFVEFEKASNKMVDCLHERAKALNDSAQLAEETSDALRNQWA